MINHKCMFCNGELSYYGINNQYYCTSCTLGNFVKYRIGLEKENIIFLSAIIILDDKIYLLLFEDGSNTLLREIKEKHSREYSYYYFDELYININKPIRFNTVNEAENIIKKILKMKAFL